MSKDLRTIIKPFRGDEQNS
ncbi:hypothetical protein VCHC50A1_0812, partial [Vibrio cholerae HC-50A1]